MSEFDFIKTHLAPLAGRAGLGLTDDAAIWQPPSGYDLVITQDTMVESVHFPRGHYGADTAEKLLRVNLSDLAAKGATPQGYMLSLTLPRGLDEKWLAAFALGLKQGQEQFELSLFGGDTTVSQEPNAPMVVSATLFGLVPKGEALLRGGAQNGDAILLTGAIGDAAMGVKVVLNQTISPDPSGQALWAWEQAYFRPAPRLGLRKALRKYATSCLDVSDGLIADAGHLARASGCGLHIDMDKVPLSTATQDWLSKADNRQAVLSGLVTGGDDYELLLTALPDHIPALMEAARIAQVPLTQIGQVCSGSGVICRDKSGHVWDFERSGWTHF